METKDQMIRDIKSDVSKEDLANQKQKLINSQNIFSTFKLYFTFLIISYTWLHCDIATSVYQIMFKKPFSFEGRIGRTEYCISYFGYFLILCFLNLAALDNGWASILLLLLAIPMIWFVVAQGAKRCHDRGNSGWYQLLPGYFIWLAFASGDTGDNEYGPSPKQSVELPA